MREFVIGLAEAAGELSVRERESADFAMRRKGGVELVTSADIAVHEYLCASIAERYPAHRVISEESVEGGSLDWTSVCRGEPTWLIDPVDGTENFARGHPHHAVSIAFLEHGRAQVGVVHAPAMGETYVAARGGGSTCNGRRITVRPTRGLEDAIVATGFPHVRDDLDGIAARVERLVLGCRDIRRSGCPTLDMCWVAAGRLDAYHETPAPWDVAAAGLIAREAGASTTHLRPPRPDMPPDVCPDQIVVAGPGLVADVVALLNRGSAD